MDNAAASAENIVPLTDRIMEAGESAQAAQANPENAREMERKRAILFRAFEITASQLERDAARMEEQAIVSDMPIKKRHEVMRTAEALRIATSWIQGALLPQPEEKNAGC